MSETKSNKANTATTATTAGRITDADIERARAQIGIARPPRSSRHEPVPSENGISHFAFSYGDDNPLWHDAEVARRTRWRGQIAPPGFLDSCGVDETPAPAPAPDIKKLFAGLFRGVGEYHSGTRWEYFRPVSAGSPVFFNRVVSGVDVREASKFAGGRSVHMSYQQLYVDRFGYQLGADEKLFISADEDSLGAAPHVLAAYRAAARPKSLLLFGGAEHSRKMFEAPYGQEVIDAIVEFVCRHV